MTSTLKALFKYLALIIIIEVNPTLIQGQWVNSLPKEVQDSIYWIGDHEEGSLYDWTLDDFLYSGGGIFNTGGNEVLAATDSVFAHSGRYAARATINNAFQAQNGSRAVRLMRWTNTAWDNGGNYFPASSYYSAFFYFPHTYNPNKYDPWDPGDGGWWNIFQFKSNDANDESQPVWTVNVYHDDQTQEMSLYLYSKYNAPNSFGQIGAITKLPAQQWVHLEAFYRASSPNVADGEIKFWQDGKLILEAQQVITVLDSANVVWGIGNYTDHIVGGPTPGSATVYFDDGIVSTLPIHPHLDMQVSRAKPISQPRLNLYPNPTDQYLKLSSPPIYPVKVLDMMGNVHAVYRSVQVLDVSDLTAGMYVLVHGEEYYRFVKR